MSAWGCGGVLEMIEFQCRVAFTVADIMVGWFQGLTGPIVGGGRGLEL